MNTRTFPKANITTTEIALGAWAIGGSSYGDVSTAQAHETIEAYFASGGNFIDTAKTYGDSEKRIGQILSKRSDRETLVIATKTASGSELANIPNIRIALENSLRALQTDYIDIYQLHQPPENPDVIKASIEVLETLKAEGKIKATGASIKGPNVTQETIDLCKTYIDAGIDVIQIIYSIARQKMSGIFGYAQSKGVGIIGRTVLESGFLTGNYNNDTQFPDGDHRLRWSPNQFQGMADIANDIKANHLPTDYETPAQVAINFALAEPALSTLILGAKSARQVQRNSAASELPPLPAETLEYLKAQYSPSFNTFNI